VLQIHSHTNNSVLFSTLLVRDQIFKVNWPQTTSKQSQKINNWSKICPIEFWLKLYASIHRSGRRQHPQTIKMITMAA